MIRKYYKLILMALFCVEAGVGQEVITYEKSYRVDNPSRVAIDVKDVDVLLKQSNDGQVHIAHKVNFNRYTRRQQEKYLKKHKVSSEHGEDIIKIRGYREGPSYSHFYKLKIFVDSNLEKKDSIKQKKTVSEFGKKRLTNNPYLLKIFHPDQYKKKRRYKNAYTILEVGVPLNVTIELNGSGTVCGIKDLEVPMKLTVDGGGVKSNSLRNTKNKFYIKDGFFQVQQLDGGEYQLNTSYKTAIGETSNAKIISDFSNIEIGQIGKNNEIIDFNGKLWFYNFSSDFGELRLSSDYSRINVFDQRLTALKDKVMGDNAPVVEGLETIKGNAVKYKVSNGLMYIHE